jgi:hypothetical protein
MELSSDIFRPWRLYAYAAWAALAGSIVSIACGVFAPFALIPAGLLALSSTALFWLAARPVVLVSASQLNIGTRAFAWQEICAIDQICPSPLLLRIELTNHRSKLLVYPGEGSRSGELVNQLRKRAFLASFDGVPYRDFELWSKLSEEEAGQLGLHQPTKMVSADEEQEIERMYQKLRLSGRLDTASKDRSSGPSKD